MTSDGATILHADLGAFYASVEQLLDPAPRGSAPSSSSSVDTSPSTRASGMRSWPSRRTSPRSSNGSRSTRRSLTCRARRTCSGPGRRSTPRSAIGSEPTSALSVGAARTKPPAKIASQVAKPDGLVGVRHGAGPRPAPDLDCPPLAVGGRAVCTPPQQPRPRGPAGRARPPRRPDLAADARKGSRRPHRHGSRALPVNRSHTSREPVSQTRSPSAWCGPRSTTLLHSL